MRSPLPHRSRRQAPPARPRRRREADEARARPAVPDLPAQRPEGRVRDAGGPQDRALYACSCGASFQAPVSASVCCPRCAAAQAW